MISTVVTLCALMTPSFADHSPLGRELVGFWPFDAKTGLQDHSGNGNDATVFGNVLRARGIDGDNDGAYYFKGVSGNDYMEISNNGALDTRESMTILLWYFPEEGGHSAPLVEYEFGQAGMFGPSLEFMNVSGILGLTATNRRRSDYQMSITTSLGKGSIIVGKWQQVGMTYDFSSGKSYLWRDGTILAEKDLGQDEQFTTSSIRLGHASAGAPGFDLKGKISCLMIFNKSLTETEVKGTMDVCSHNGLVGFWPFKADTGVQDMSGNGNDATVFGEVLPAVGINEDENGSYLFKGVSDNDYIAIGNNGALDTRYSMTMLLWFYPKEGHSAPLVQYDLGSSGYFGPTLEYKNIFGTLGISASTRRRSDYVRTNVHASGDGIITIAEWQQVGMSYDYNSGKVYLWKNGKVLAERDVGRDQQYTIPGLRLGHATASTPGFDLEGKVSCLMIFNKALSKKEVEASMGMCKDETPKRKNNVCVAIAMDVSESIEDQKTKEQEALVLNTFWGILSENVEKLENHAVDVTILPFSEGVLVDEVTTLSTRNYKNMALFVETEKKNWQDIENDIARRNTSGLTNLGAVFNYVHSMNCKKNSKLLIVVSDFITTLGNDNLDSVLENTKNDGTKVVAVGLDTERIDGIFEKVKEISGLAVDMMDNNWQDDFKTAVNVAAHGPE